jgi:triphosphoribosyl-dephospho-CoA synthase
MSRGLDQREIEALFLAACRAELSALKPGNVHVHEPGHGMVVKHFEDAAVAAAPHIANPSLSVGARILKATQASFAATGLNTNLGIVLLCAPLAQAAAEMTAELGLRRRLGLILSTLSVEDARDAFRAIELANPAGLGTAAEGDVHQAPKITLIEAMHLAAGRDRIANAYVTAFSEIFDFALPILKEARGGAATPDLAVTKLHMTLLAEYPDSHIARKYGLERAMAVQTEARDLRPAFDPVPAQATLAILAKFDASLKVRGLNPGTTADFVVASLFAEAISAQKQS